MTNVCFYFQVHQPYRLRDLRIGELGRGDMFDDTLNRNVFRKVAEKCYLPTNALLLSMLERHPAFHCSFSLSGVFLEQCKEYGPDVLESFQKLVNTGRVELLTETSHHSLAVIKSIDEFCDQVAAHQALVKELFGVTPTVFRNTELIFNNYVANVVRELGFKGIIAEGVDGFLGDRSATHLYTVPGFMLPEHDWKVIERKRTLPNRSDDISVLLKHYKLSDDIAFRFSSKEWTSYPLHADTFADWVQSTGGHTINLFMDYETFGEHQWESTGIFRFLESLPEMFARKGIRTATPSLVIESWGDGEKQLYDVHTYISWADSERDLSAWQGNHMQDAALDAIFALEQDIKRIGDEKLLADWRKLLTSDHFYYMCTKFWSDGDVHKYFSPYESPYEAYRRFSHALEDVRMRLNERKQSAPVTTHIAPTRTRSFWQMLGDWYRTFEASLYKERSLPLSKRSA